MDHIYPNCKKGNLKVFSWSNDTGNVQQKTKRGRGKDSKGNKKAVGIRWETKSNLDTRNIPAAVKLRCGIYRTIYLCRGKNLSEVFRKLKNAVWDKHITKEE